VTKDVSSEAVCGRASAGEQRLRHHRSIIHREPDKSCTRRGSRSASANGENVIASDASAIVAHAARDLSGRNDIAIIHRRLHLRPAKALHAREIAELGLDSAAAEKGRFRTFHAKSTNVASCV
jgi:hypothetical protein